MRPQLYRLIIFIIAIFLASYLYLKDNPQNIVQRRRLQVAESSPLPSPKPRGRPICSTPLSLQIGSIDPQFGLGREKLVKLVTEAAKEWEDATGRRWFTISNKQGMAINFIFDGRQQALQEDAQEGAALKAQIEAARREQPLPEASLNILLERYERYRLQHEKLSQPVPWAQHIHQAGMEAIDVFAFSDREQLHATLLHELGHALGLGHLPQHGALMYELREVTTADVHLSQYDVEAALSLCELR